MGVRQGKRISVRVNTTSASPDVKRATSPKPVDPPAERVYAILRDEPGTVLVLGGLDDGRSDDSMPITVVAAPGQAPYEITDGDVLKYTTEEELRSGETRDWLLDEFDMLAEDGRGPRDGLEELASARVAEALATVALNSTAPQPADLAEILRGAPTSPTPKQWDQDTRRFYDELAVPITAEQGLDPLRFENLEAFQVAFTDGTIEFLENMGQDPYMVDADLDAIAEKLWDDSRTDDGEA